MTMTTTPPIIKLVSIILFEFVLNLMISNINGQSLRFPPNPCPDIFSYQNDNRDNYGQIMIPYDNSQMFVLDVNASMVGYYDNLKLKLTLLTPVNNIRPGTVLQFRLDFPLRNVLPRITDVIYNKNVYCSGAPEPIGREGVTSLWATVRYQLAPVGVNVIDNNQNPIFQLPTLPAQPTYTLPTVPTIPDDYYPDIFVLPTESSQQSPDFNVVPSTTERPVVLRQSTKSPPPNEIVDRLPTFERNCGIANDIQNLVINGVPTGESEFPWLIAMFHREGPKHNFKCTANLISDKHAITAAHCVHFQGGKGPQMPKENILLILGTTNLNQWSTIRTLEEIFVNPDYRRQTGHGDVAIVTLTENVEISRTIRPICLWKGDTILEQIINQNGTVAGWGKDENGNSYVDTPRKVAIPVVAQRTCLWSNTVFNKLTSEMTFCAGSKDGRGPCTGDSGSGFMMRRDGKWTLRGVVSFAVADQIGKTCNLTNYVVFSDVAQYGDWVRTTINQ